MVFFLFYAESKKRGARGEREQSSDDLGVFLIQDFVDTAFVAHFPMLL